MSSEKNCICVICFKPRIEWVEFLNKFENYETYLVIDDNSQVYKFEESNVNIIQINNDECKSNSFTYVGFKHMEVSGWDKALYYFSKVNLKSTVWFLEDDVFFYNEETIKKIDEQYPKHDFLSSNMIISKQENVSQWCWPEIIMHIHEELPYYSSMICAVRMSDKMLNCIKTHADKYLRLYFAEAIFNTICKKNNLIDAQPIELKNIHFEKDKVFNNFDKDNIYHPIKDLNKHLEIRNKMN